MDRQQDPATLKMLREAARQVPGVRDVEKLWVRKAGLEYLADIHDLERKQLDDINALLNEDQKKELREIEEKASADVKTKAGAKKDPAMSDGEK